MHLQFLLTMLTFIGIGLNDEKDITVKGLEAIKQADLVYLEVYTSILQVPIQKLEEFYGKQIIAADRELVEQEGDRIISEAKNKNVCFLVIGDVFTATTHTDLFLRAKKAKVKTKIINNATIISAASNTGLELYKFGKTTSIPFSDGRYTIETPYKVLQENLSLGMHTLLLLDIQVTNKQQRFMTVKEAIKYLKETERALGKGIIKDNMWCIGIARLGSDDEVIKAGTIEQLQFHDFGKPPHALIIPGKLHFIEEEIMNYWKAQPL